MLADPSSAPTVSCILATRDRPQFFPQALRCFNEQRGIAAELIVVDDGDVPVEPLCAGLPQVRYLRLEQPTPLGEKLNLGIAKARAPILQKLDDDDYYHPHFLARAAASLPGEQPEREIAAWDCFFTLLAGELQARWSGHGWSAGGTLCFHRKVWERRPFRPLPRSVDSWFLRDHQPLLQRVCAPHLYLLVRHGNNTWRQMAGGESADDFLRRLPVHSAPLETLVSAEAFAIYQSLVFGLDQPDVPRQLP